MKIPVFSNPEFKKAMIFGAGLTVGFIAISAGIKLFNKFSPVDIPNAYVPAQAKYGSYWGTMGNSLNSLDPGTEPGVYNLT